MNGLNEFVRVQFDEIFVNNISTLGTISAICNKSLIKSNSGGISSSVEIHENSIMKYIHLFWTEFEHEFAFGGGSGDSGDFFC